MTPTIDQEAPVPVAYVQEFPVDSGGDRSTTNYDAVNDRLNVAAEPPEGLLVHTAGFDEAAGVFRVFDVWETREHGERFLRERLLPVLTELFGGPPPEGMKPTRDEFYDLHDVVKG
jgi:hypothetical protein